MKSAASAAPRDVATQPRPRDVLGTFGIYAHVPFCERRCWYCDFNAFAGLDELAPAYMTALCEDVAIADGLTNRPVVTSIFIGGGTPSLVDATEISKFLDVTRENWDVDARAEITIECNPESATPEKLREYRDAGVNLLSFGVQSLNDELLAKLGRLHSANRALEIIAEARAIFDDVSADLIFGIPGETDDDLSTSIAKLISSGVCHMSVYGLTYESGTPLESWRKLGRVVPELEDDVARRWELADEILGAAGFPRYEVSNWARNAKESQHNSLYWAFGEYLGVGAGAHSHISDAQGSTRSWVVKGLERYIATPGERAGSERVKDRAGEIIMLGLRLREGVSFDAFSGLTNVNLIESYETQIAKYQTLGLLELHDDRVKLTRRGTLLANEVVASFLVD